MAAVLELQPGEVHFRVQGLHMHLTVAHFHHQDALLGEVVGGFGEHAPHQVQAVESSVDRARRILGVATDQGALDPRRVGDDDRELLRRVQHDVHRALAHVDPQDGWETHFKDTMKGGSFLNHWRMAQLHAQEAPDRVRELEQWGALFDRTADGRILQRAFGGHTWKRLAHVGDRTGLEMIRTLQDRGVHQGLDVYMECTILHLFTDAGRIAGALGYWRESGRFVVFRAPSVVLATGGTAAATLSLVERSGGTIAGFVVVLELGFLNGRNALPGREVHALLTT